MIAHVFSDLVLCVTALAVFLVYFQKQPIYNRLLWGIFMMSISLTALAGVFLFAGWDELAYVRESLQRLELTLGAVCMVVASWALINRRDTGRLAFWGTIGVGAGIFLGLAWYGLGVMVQIIQPLCLVITLLIACLGLARRQKSALWVVFSMTLLALAAKSKSIPLPIHPIDVNHYLIALSTFCAGKAAQFEYSILFK
ncbi:hypothetical protein GCM10027275_55000 [Rhabdobacter roseus]|uniref:Uncharacterized protein n=1 Tax=Rhabdobacter roseus TaxID=1655419 RepID=A0A840TX53_9BACT|nr:hypothetical protein [Rhabdobacter roseus]MBB5287515.1 hypothetical protein [Rhabdobacter roseus]